VLYHRAGLSSADDFLWSLSQTIDVIENSPANKLMSAEASSLAAPFIDGTLHRQRTNLPNTSLSYYLKGELIALNLDLIIRGRTQGRQSLDDVMRRAYDEFYAKSPVTTGYLKGRGYTMEDFARIVSDVAGMDMNDFFTRYVRGVEPLPYNEALAAVGLRLEKKLSSLPYTGGIVIDREGSGLRLGALRTNSPAERGGLQQGDALISIAGTPVTRDNWMFALNRYKEGDRVAVTVRRFRQNLNLTLQLGPPEMYDYQITEIPNSPAAARARRSAWLAGR
jgi:predicted metalloprotease with PDZ domain